MATLRITLTSADTKLGRETIKQLIARGHQLTGIGQDADSAKIIWENGALYAEANLASASELDEAFCAAKPDVVLNLTPPNC